MHFAHSFHRKIEAPPLSERTRSTFDTMTSSSQSVFCKGRLRLEAAGGDTSYAVLERLLLRREEYVDEDLIGPHIEVRKDERKHAEDLGEHVAKKN